MSAFNTYLKHKCCFIDVKTINNTKYYHTFAYVVIWRYMTVYVRSAGFQMPARLTARAARPAWVSQPHSSAAASHGHSEPGARAQVANVPVTFKLSDHGVTVTASGRPRPSEAPGRVAESPSLFWIMISEGPGVCSSSDKTYLLRIVFSYNVMKLINTLCPSHLFCNQHLEPCATMIS